MNERRERMRRGPSRRRTGAKFSFGPISCETKRLDGSITENGRTQSDSFLAPSSAPRIVPSRARLSDRLFRQARAHPLTRAMRSTLEVARVPALARGTLPRARARRCARVRADASRSTVPSTMGLEKILNFRDLADAGGALVPGRVFRTATPGGASEFDAETVLGRLGVRALLDLRSDDEFEPDPGLVQDAFEIRAFDRGDDADASLAEWSRAVGADAAARRLVRYHAPLLDYDRYYAEIFRRMGKWEKVKAVAFSAQAKLVDPTNQRRLFVGKVNDGGLYLLNEVMLDSSGPEIRAALEVMSNVTEDAPLAFYCKAGKDRTGIVAALALHCCGVSEDDIVADYHRSDAAGSSALGGGKIERGLSIDYSRFRGAPKEVMEHALEHARRKHGSVDGYLDSIGFDSDARYRLARALCS